ncbi:hypothetical protein HELRODRAFT_184170 [Helobdella robusta]|uniref:Uncharacterized protein n=1 Tax=Helobdella robusta TaxID=6412 RepID=T1FKP7_HELRO|nr:hypothetical protein HELRODRAFT_184170 [Helobdella robusta]ESO06754.1 hypothetical protein HELRODRAFT_184170 [Helobdella robusta]
MDKHVTYNVPKPTYGSHFRLEPNGMFENDGTIYYLDSPPYPECSKDVVHTIIDHVDHVVFTPETVKPSKPQDDDIASAKERDMEIYEKRMGHEQLDERQS